MFKKRKRENSNSDSEYQPPKKLRKLSPEELQRMQQNLQSEMKINQEIMLKMCFWNGLADAYSKKNQMRKAGLCRGVALQASNTIPLFLKDVVVFNPAGVWMAIANDRLEVRDTSTAKYCNDQVSKILKNKFTQLTDNAQPVVPKGLLL